MNRSHRIYREAVRYLVLAAAVLLCGIVSASLVGAPAWAISSRVLFRPTGAAAGDMFGISVSDAGDVNGDGYADVIVGAPQNDAGGANAGRAYVYYGGPGADDVADLSLTGAVPGDLFGTSVSGAGDVNGDGYADVIAGAPKNDAGGTEAGRAYVYYGGQSMDAVADLTLTGATFDQLGYSVSAAGDVNRDGYADVIVGAISNSAGGNAAGRAYVYFGGPGADAVADLTMTGAAADDHFGTSVSEAGDVNGDGYGDVIVGAPYNTTGGLGAGRAYVYYGGLVPNAVADLTMTGAAEYDYLGNTLSGAGDVNGDGYADVIVGALQNDAGGSNAGRAYVYYGGPAPNAVPDLILTGAAAGEELGAHVSGAGDLNGDGYADLIVGARQGGTGSGRAYVYYGGPAPNAVADLTLVGEVLNDSFGWAVSGAGDVDGDGFGDVIVGAWDNDAAGPGAGRAYVYSSRPYEVLSPDGGEQWVVGREERVRWLGADPADLWISFDGGATYSLLASVAGGGEQNEFAIIVPEPATSSARVRVSASGEPVTVGSTDASDGVFTIVRAVTPPSAAARVQLAPTGQAGGDNFGYSASAAGDVNGDGYADVIVGAYANDAGGADAGRAYVYFGGPAANAIADLTLTGAAAGDNFGYSVSGAGDVNGDGYADVIVGAWQNDAGGTDAGRAYVYFGGPVPDAVADLTLTGAAPADYFGVSVSAAGDVNGDSYGDLIVGNNESGAFPIGHAYVYFGGPAPNAVADLVFSGEGVNEYFGTSVGTAGDMNGDGRDDLIVGAYGNGAGGSLAGRAYVYYGGPAADAAADLVLTGAAPSNFFGQSVHTAGDMNGDGYSDVIVGAYANAAGGPGAGRAYVYHGGPGADATADLTLTGAAGDAFGLSVSGAGDVNRDGFADVIVGAFASAAGGAGAGRAYVYYGGPGADAIVDLTLTGVAGDVFGYSVSGAGDVNKDGFADVIVGAFGNDAAGADAGRAYVYDMNRYHLLSPIGGETWNVGAIKTISWLGAEPAMVSLSTDGGQSYEPLFPSSSGSDPTNAVTVRVPHTPTKFALVRVSPINSGVGGFDQSDSLFTIQTSVSLLSMLAAALPQGGATISWQSDPGPQDLLGYRLEKGVADGSEWRTLVSLTRETSVTDPEGGPGSRYRLLAVNGFGEELWLGEVSLRAARSLAAWPLPYRGGAMSISFATGGGLGGGRGEAEVSIYDVSGRLVRRIARGQYMAGYQIAQWDGRDGRGQKVSSGIYFLRSVSGGEQRTLRLSVLR